MINLQKKTKQKKYGRNTNGSVETQATGIESCLVAAPVAERFQISLRPGRWWGHGRRNAVRQPMANPNFASRATTAIRPTITTKCDYCCRTVHRKRNEVNVARAGNYSQHVVLLYTVTTVLSLQSRIITNHHTAATIYPKR